MHDPSGCNSTYNTHDEIRWYDKDSLIFISGLTERDAVMGNDEKFYRDVLETARKYSPSFVAVTNSPVPYLMSTDFTAITKRLERELEIPVFYVPANGMHDYTAGAGGAFERVARRLVRDTNVKIPDSVNILGMTPLDFAAKGSAFSIKKIFEDAGFKVISVWAMDDSLENIKKAGEASVNIVVSSAGLRAAKVLLRRFGTPYTAGVPVSGFSEVLMECARKASESGTNIIAYEECFKNSYEPFKDTYNASAGRQGKANDACGNLIPPSGINAVFPKDDECKDPVTLIGDPVIMGSLAAALRIKRGLDTRLICPCEGYQGLLPKYGKAAAGEEEIEKELLKASVVIGDPFYRLLTGKDTKFYDLPTLSLSGRSHLKEAKDITKLNI